MLRLESFSYSEFEDQLNSWSVDGLAFGQVNLLVGKNSSGKTRILNVIGSLSKLLVGSRKELFSSGGYRASFRNDAHDAARAAVYSVDLHDRNVVGEQLYLDDNQVLDRGDGGVGRILSHQISDMIDFQCPQDQLAAVARRDTIQHPFFEELHDWASHVQHCHFVVPPSVVIVTELQKIPGIEEAYKNDNPDHSMQWYAAGYQKYGDAFDSSLKQSMAKLGYLLDDIQFRSLGSSGATPLFGFVTKERDLRCETSQQSMSAGMFRALNLLIRITVATFEKRPSLLLIDDIGEGLDFARASALVELVTSFAEEVIFAIREIEAWFLAQPSVFERIDSTLTVERISEDMGLDLATIDVETITHPSELIRRILELVGQTYRKRLSQIHSLVSRLDYTSLFLEAPSRVGSFSEFLEALDTCATSP